MISTILCLLFFLAIAGYAAAFIVLKPRLKLGSALLAGFALMLFMSYTLIIVFSLYNVGPFIVIAAGLALLPSSIYCMVKYHRSRLQSLVCPSAAVYLALCAFAAIIIGEGAFSAHDAYSFWARAVREMYIERSFYININSSINHTDYNPMFAALEYSLMRVFGWSDAGAIYVTAAPLVIVGTMFTDHAHWKEIWKGVIAAVVGIIVYSSLDNTIRVSSIYIDGPMAMLFVGGLITFSDAIDGESAISLVLVCAVLPGVKLYSGLLFSIALIVALIIARLYRKQRILTIMAALILALFMQFSWSGIYNYNTHRKDYAESIAAAEYLGKEVPEEESISFSLQYLVSGNYRNKSIDSKVNLSSLKDAFMTANSEMKILLTTPVVKSRVLFWQMYAALAALILITIHILTSEERRRYILLLHIAIIASAVYYIGLLAALVIQPQTITSYSRYIDVIYIYLFMLTLWQLCRTQRKFAPFIALATGAAVFVGFSPSFYTTVINTVQYSCANLAETSYTENVAQYAKDNRTLIVDSRDYKGAFVSTSGLPYTYQYYSLPEYVQALVYRYGNTDDYSAFTEDILTSKVTQNRISRVVVMIDDQIFADRFTAITGCEVMVGGVTVLDVSIVDEAPVYTVIEQ